MAKRPASTPLATCTANAGRYSIGRQKAGLLRSYTSTTTSTSGLLLTAPSTCSGLISLEKISRRLVSSVTTLAVALRSAWTLSLRCKVNRGVTRRLASQSRGPGLPP